MTNNLKNRIIAFIRNIADQCRICLRHNDLNCNDCVSTTANQLLSEITKESRSNIKVDYSFYGRVEMIKRILKEAKRPLSIKEIDLRHVCSPQLKYWTINRMVYNRTIGRIRSYKNNRRIFLYYLKTNKETK